MLRDGRHPMIATLHRRFCESAAPVTPVPLPDPPPSSGQGAAAAVPRL